MLVEEDTRLPQILERAIGARAQKHFFQFLTNALTRKILRKRRAVLERLKRLRVVLPVQKCSQPNDTQKTQSILAKSQRWLTDHPNKTFFHVGFAVERIEQLAADGMKVERINGAVSSLCICLACTENNAFRPSP